MAREKAPQDANDKAQRRVYVLPNELVERIGEFQKELGLASEVEAVRRLLDGALKSRDSVVRIVARLAAQHKIVKSVRDAAKEVLIDHPLVASIRFPEDYLEFDLKDGHTVEFNRYGKALIKDDRGDLHTFWDEVPDWASSRHKPTPSFKGPSPGSVEIDDDIPF